MAKTKVKKKEVEIELNIRRISNGFTIYAYGDSFNDGKTTYCKDMNEVIEHIKKVNI